MFDKNCFCQNKICLFSKSCCWCLDKNINKKIYIDGCGLILPSDFDVVMPQDLYYCAKCKITNKTQFDIIQELTTKIPSVYETQAKNKKEENDKQKEESYKKNILRSCETKLIYIKTKLSDLSNPKTILYRNTKNPILEIQILKKELKETIQKYETLSEYYKKN